MKKILVPTDFSTQSDYALEVACEIARRANSEIILLHIVESSSSSAIKITGEMDFGSQEEKLYMFQLIGKAKEELEERQKRPECEGSNINIEVRVGNSYHGIKSLILEEKVDFVVMGTSGKNSFEEYLVGSTTEKVVRFSKCPVLTIHKKPETFDYKHIVFATGMQDDEKECLDIVKMAQKLYDSTIHIVRINTPNNFEKDKESLFSMKLFAEKNGLEKYTLNIFNDVSEEEGIISFAEHINADLIAIATHGRTGFAHLLSGSIAEDVVSHANRPVLTHVIRDN